MVDLKSELLKLSIDEVVALLKNVVDEMDISRSILHRTVNFYILANDEEESEVKQNNSCENRHINPNSLIFLPSRKQKTTKNG